MRDTCEGTHERENIFAERGHTFEGLIQEDIFHGASLRGSILAEEGKAHEGGSQMRNTFGGAHLCGGEKTRSGGHRGGHK